MPAVVPNRDYYLSVNGIVLACPAWQITNIGELFDDPDVRGDDTPLPYVSGETSHRRRTTGSIYTFNMEIIGQRDTDGSTIANAPLGLITHRDYLRANLGLAKATGDGTVPFVFYRSTAASLTASGHFLGFKGSRFVPPATLYTTFDIKVTSAGGFV